MEAGAGKQHHQVLSFVTPQHNKHPPPPPETYYRKKLNFVFWKCLVCNGYGVGKSKIL